MTAPIGDGKTGGEVVVPPDMAALVDIDVDEDPEEHRRNSSLLRVLEAIFDKIG